ncbi:MAG: hypothetical protein PVH40_04355 [Gemmatimonadales bacterium]
MSPTTVDVRTDDIPVAPPPRRGQLLALAIVALALLGGIALVTAAVVTTQIDIEDLLDSLEPVRFPVLLLVVVTIVAWKFTTGRAWARWVLAAVLALGAAWVLLRFEISGVWLRVALTAALAWGLCAVALLGSPSVAAYVGSKADHWMVTYERLIGPLETEEHARRWLAMLETWDQAGVLTRGDRKRIVRALSMWSERTGAGAGDIDTQLERLRERRAWGRRLPSIKHLWPSRAARSRTEGT